MLELCVRIKLNCECSTHNAPPPKDFGPDYLKNPLK